MKVQVLEVGFLRTNCYIVSDENGAAAVIDPGDRAETILRLLDDSRLCCEAVLITHGHFDHVGGLVALREKTGARLVMSGLDRRSLRVDEVIDCPVEDGDTVAVGELSFSVIATPGHSPGGVCYLAGNWLFSGDTLFFETAGRTDIPYADAGALARSLRRLRDLPFDDLVVYPGHMRATTLRHERAHNPFLR